ARVRPRPAGGQGAALRRTEGRRRRARSAHRARRRARLRCREARGRGVRSAPPRDGRRGGARPRWRPVPRRARAGRSVGAGRLLRAAARRRPARRRRGGRRDVEGALGMLNSLDVSLAGRDLLRIGDLVPAEAEAILDLAVELRAEPKQPLLPGATLGLYFSKHSTRTRVSFSAGIAQLGGVAIPLSPEELQLSRGESLPDTARALSRYLDVLAVRTHEHAELEAWAEWASIPVINALTAKEHPCQALADALTMRDRLGSLDGVRVAWVGDGSNVLVSLAALGDLLGYEVVAACPPGYEP